MANGFFLVVRRKTLMGILFLLSILLLQGVSLVLPFSKPVFSPIYEGPEVQKVTITVNVDWGEEHLPKMLRIMEEHEVLGTFFVTGYFGERFPELLQKIVDAGHDLENHGFLHLHPNTLSKGELVSLIKDNEALIEELTGVRTRYFAPPYGEYNEAVLEVTKELGYELIMWSVDSIDWQRPGPQIIRDRVLEGVREGSIILIHPIDQTIVALEEIILGIKDKDLLLVPLSSLLKE